MDTDPIRASQDFRRLLISEVIGTIPEEIAYVGVPFQAYRISHSSLIVGTIVLFALIPMLIAAIGGGLLADVIDKKLVILGSRILSTLSVLILFFDSGPRTVGLSLLIVGALVRYFAIFLRSPSIESLVPVYVRSDQLAAGAATVSSLENLVQLVMVPVAGLLIASVGLKMSYAIGIVVAAIAVGYSFTLAPARPPGDRRSSDSSAISSALRGFRYAATRKDLLGTYLIDFLAMLFGVPNSLFPQIASRSGGAGFLGLMYAAPSLGSFVMSLASGWTSRIRHYGRAIVSAAMVWGLALIPIGFVNSKLAILTLLAIAGAADMVSGIFRRAFWNLTIPSSVRGRMAAIEMVSYTSGPAIGGFESGVVERLFGLETSIVSGGILSMVSVGLAASLLPTMWNFRSDRFSGTTRDQTEDT
ncbi:MAG: MFS transporter [Acidimicrobiaceae bacterium]|nr:MFS transporter [Acidimicrobiaceae bacterium]